MNLPARAVDVIYQLYRLNETLAKGNDNQRRQLTRKIAEQLRFDLGPKWGTKATHVDAPPSKDAIAYMNEDGALDIWDWQDGNTREPHVRINQPPSYPNERQYFIMVDSVNHLGEIPIPVPSDPPNLPPINVEDELDSISDSLQLMRGDLGLINQKLTKLAEKKPPTYEAKLFGYTITFTPK